MSKELEDGITESGGRRDFLKSVGLTGLVACGLTGCGDSNNDEFVNTNNNNGGGNNGGVTARQQQAIDFRTARAVATNSTPVVHQNNGDEALFNTNFIGSFSKTLPHNDLGEVDVAAFTAFANAIDNFDVAGLENVPSGGTGTFVNPFAGQAFTISGTDGQSVTMPPAPTFSSAETAAEMVDLYWMALCRDVSFTNFGVDATVAAAVAELNTLTDYTPGQVSPATLFRGPLAGDDNGPYISQFLWQTVSYGATTYEQLITPTVAGLDYMTTQVDAVNIQRGIAPGPEAFQNTTRYISTIRDLANFVHIDALYQAYHQAALILLGQGIPLDPGFPFAGSRGSGFATFGGPMVLGLVAEVAVKALKAAWYQKWNIHRRLRPEAMGIRTEVHLTNQANYPIHPQLLNSQAVQSTINQQGTALLSQVYPEGSPNHPSYGAGHAAVAAACTTVLKALFEGSTQLQNPVEASADGSTLNAIGGNFTVNGELNKLASNISIGRNGAGVHYITDYTNSLTMGENVAISIIADTLAASDVAGSVTLQKFDGSTTTISG